MTNNLNLTVTGTGDSLFVAHFPSEYSDALRKVADFINSCDVKITNLETNLSDFEYYASAYSGGTWLNTRRECLADLLKFGFNYFGNANNHAFDYSYNGLLSTIDCLDSQHLAHSGTGRGLEEAARPALLQINGCQVAVFAVDASFETASKAGLSTHATPARPGVNYLRHDTFFHIDDNDLRELQRIAEKTHINYNRESSIATGYKTPDPEGVYVFGNKTFTTNPDTPASKCNADDLKRITSAIAEAKKSCGYVFMLIHCHDNDNIREENPPAYLKEFAHACIDAGAAAIFGGGSHRLRPIEMYNGFPIFYSLGDFIYQGLKVEHLPADFMEKYHIDRFSTAEQALYARSRGNTVGLHCNKKNYQTVLPKLEYENGRLTSFTMLPIYLSFDRKDDMNGLPVIAPPAEAEEIYTLLQELSAPYGTKLSWDGHIISCASPVKS